jgi:hypothetical protein
MPGLVRRSGTHRGDGEADVGDVELGDLFAESVVLDEQLHQIAARQKVKHLKTWVNR